MQMLATILVIARILLPAITAQAQTIEQPEVDLIIECNRVYFEKHNDGGHTRTNMLTMDIYPRGGGSPAHFDVRDRHSGWLYVPFAIDYVHYVVNQHIVVRQEFEYHD
jgi:hypothetical protein